MLKRIIAVLSFSVCGLIFSSSVFAGGFQVSEQDASGIGDSHAGSGAEANGAGTEFYNPAGMTNLPHFEASGGTTYIPLDIHFNGVVGAANTPTLASSHTDNFIPNYHLVYPVNHQIALGLGFTVPFGLETIFPADNPISVAATKTNLTTININPNIAYAPSKYISFALGFDVLYGSAVYDNTNPVFTGFALKNKLSGWAYGWNTGVMFYLTPGTRIGVSYRSEIDLDGTGTSFDEQSGITLHDLSGEIKLPPSWNFSLYSELDSRFAVLFSTYYTQWSVFNDLILNNVTLLGNTIKLGVHENYRNTLAFAAGVHVKLMKNLTLKLGFGHDQTPTQDFLRDIRLPDSDRYSFAMGLQWHFSRAFKVDFGWMHLISETAQVNNTRTAIDYSVFTPLIALLTRTVGTANGNAEVIGMQLSWTPAAPAA